MVGTTGVLVGWVKVSTALLLHILEILNTKYCIIKLLIGYLDNLSFVYKLLLFLWLITGWYSTYERAVSVSFTKPFRKAIGNVFFVKRGNPENFEASDLTGKTIGFLDGAAANEFCIQRTQLPVGAIDIYSR